MYLLSSGTGAPPVPQRVFRLLGPPLLFTRGVVGLHVLPHALDLWAAQRKCSTIGLTGSFATYQLSSAFVHVPPANCLGLGPVQPATTSVMLWSRDHLSAGASIVLGPTLATLALATPTFMVRLSTSSLMREYSLELRVPSRKPILLVSAAWPCGGTVCRACEGWRGLAAWAGSWAQAKEAPQAGHAVDAGPRWGTLERLDTRSVQQLPAPLLQLVPRCGTCFVAHVIRQGPRRDPARCRTGEQHKLTSLTRTTPQNGTQPPPLQGVDPPTDWRRAINPLSRQPTCTTPLYATM